MSGHSKWKQIKHKKEAADQARGKLFSKLANTISIAARQGADPQFNASLKSAIEQAKKHNMPQANIDRAIKKASDDSSFEELLLEVYGPGGIGVLVEIKTDNKNRTLGELKLLLKKHNSKLADPGSLMWSFEKKDNTYIPKFPAVIPDEVKKELSALVDSLKNLEEVFRVFPTTDTLQK
jgi:YebC/PmpR family DNA-binding regulatory protein